MTFEQLVFYILAGIAVIASFMMITVNNPVKAALWLILAFFATGGVWITAQAEFLGIVLILVYAGAVMVLFLFVVMMLDINLAKLREGFIRYLPIGILAAILTFVMMYLVVGPDNFGPEIYSDPMRLAMDDSNTKAIGSVLYTEHAYAFILAAVLLLVGIIAAIALTIRRRPMDEAKYQNIDAQVKVQAKDRLQMVKMDSVPTEPKVQASKEDN